MKKGLLAIFAILLLILLPINVLATEDLTVEIQSESKVVKDDDLKLKLHTNLPKKMKFYATITGANAYEKEIKAKVDKDGDLYKKVKNLDVGKYTITYKSYKPKKQSKKVKKVIGKNGGYLKGANIKDGVITFTETLEVKAPVKETPKDSFKEKAEKNAEKYPAVPGAILYTKGDTDVTGLKYYFEGDLMSLNKVDGILAWMVKNQNGYVMPIFPDHAQDEAIVGDKVKIWGTLTGDGYQASDFAIPNVVGMTGSMHLIQVNINGEDKI